MVIVNNEDKFWSGVLWEFLIEDAKIYDDSETDIFCSDLEGLSRITNCKGVSVDDELEEGSL